MPRDKSGTHDDSSHDDGAWLACSKGELTGLAERLRAEDVGRQRRDSLRKVGGAAVVVVALLLGAGFLAGPEAARTGIACPECVANFDAYHRHLSEVQSMDATLAIQMRDHLTQCHLCRGKFEEEFPGVLKLAAEAGKALLLSQVLVAPVVGFTIIQRRRRAASGRRG